MQRRDQAMLDLHQIQREANIPANRRWLPTNDNISEADLEHALSVIRQAMERRT